MINYKNIMMKNYKKKEKQKEKQKYKKYKSGHLQIDGETKLWICFKNQN